MADTGKEKSKKKLDNFAEDLDAMLDTDVASAAQHVGLIDDDDAIDRLLMSDSFQQTDQEFEEDEFADIDALIGADLGSERKVVDLIDEFEDTETQTALAKVIDEPDRQVDEFDEFADMDEEQNQINNFTEIEAPELSALETVVATDEFFAVDEDLLKPDNLNSQQDEIENMAEIDEFSELTSIIDNNNADFLMADFDISSEDDFASTRETEVDEQPINPTENEHTETEAALSLSPAADSEFNSELIAPRSDLKTPDIAQNTVIAIDHSVELAALAAQIAGLKKQQLIFKQEVSERVGKDELTNILESLGSLETEQKKVKRAVETVSNKKPLTAYVANGVALLALAIGSGLGFQGYIAKSQVTELTGIIGKMQEQLNQAPNGQAADNALLRKEVDALTIASSVSANQIAEITKTLQNDSGSVATKSGADLGKKIADLNNQNMEIGAELENLQNKISVLEKSRATVAAATFAKPEPKKPPVVIENWAVNLIAFKQDWYAKRKADEFAAKGVPAKVSKTETKGEIWYRLSVDGFKSQYEAAGYAAKIKKSLNLDSVWLTRIK